MKLFLRRKPRYLTAEQWDGPGDYRIPDEHTLNKGTVLYVHPGDYIAMASQQDWYPLTWEVLAETMEIIRETP